MTKNRYYFHHYIQNVKDGIQIREYKINKEKVTHLVSEKILGSHSEKDKKIEAKAKW